MDGVKSDSPRRRTCLPVGRKDAKMRASLAELTEGAGAKIHFACPEEFPGQAKRLF